MTLESFIPLVDFYKIYVEHLKKSKYKLLLCLIARKADVPLMFKEIRENWSSLHDVTGEHILFMFAGENLEDTNREQSLTYTDLDFKRGYLGHQIYLSLMDDCMIFSQKDSTHLGFMDYDFMLRIGEGHPRLNSDEDFEDSHSLEIRNLAEYLSIKESEIPCLNITYLPLNFSSNIRVQPDSSIYSIIKSISSEFYEGKLNSIVKSKLFDELIQKKTALEVKLHEKLEHEDSTFVHDYLRTKDLGIEIPDNLKSLVDKIKNLEQEINNLNESITKSGDYDEYLQIFKTFISKHSKSGNNNYQDIRHLISKGRIEDALKNLLKMEVNKDHLKNVIIQISSRFNNLKKETLNGTINKDEYDIKINKISYSILEVINEMEN